MWFCLTVLTTHVLRVALEVPLTPGLEHCLFHREKSNGSMSTAQHFSWASGSININWIRNNPCPDQLPDDCVSTEKGLSCVSYSAKIHENQSLGNAFLLTPLPFFQTKWMPKLMGCEKYWGECLLPCDHISLIFIGGWIIHSCRNDLRPSLGTLSCLQQNPISVLFLRNLLIPGDDSVTFIGNVLFSCFIFRFKKVVFKPCVVYGLSMEDMKNRLFLSLFKPTVIVPPFSSALQTVIYTFEHFCSKCWENENREIFSPRILRQHFLVRQTTVQMVTSDVRIKAICA